MDHHRRRSQRPCWPCATCLRAYHSSPTALENLSGSPNTALYTTVNDLSTGLSAVENRNGASMTLSTTMRDFAGSSPLVTTLSSVKDHSPPPAAVRPLNGRHGLRHGRVSTALWWALPRRSCKSHVRGSNSSTPVDFRVFWLGCAGENVVVFVLEVLEARRKLHKDTEGAGPERGKH